jgi:hypothetical protein
MHHATGYKIDLIVRKASEYRQTEFARRQRVALGSVQTWVVSREDLILSKLEWSRESRSEQQARDIRDLLQGPIDRPYLRRWAAVLGVDARLQELMP